MKTISYKRQEFGIGLNKKQSKEPMSYKSYFGK
jgi:hypothetical protein